MLGILHQAGRPGADSSASTGHEDEATRPATRVTVGLALVRSHKSAPRRRRESWRFCACAAAGRRAILSESPIAPRRSGTTCFHRNSPPRPDGGLLLFDRTTASGSASATFWWFDACHCRERVHEPVGRVTAGPELDSVRFRRSVTD